MPCDCIFLLYTSTTLKNLISWCFMPVQQDGKWHDAPLFCYKCYLSEMCETPGWGWCCCKWRLFLNRFTWCTEESEEWIKSVLDVCTRDLVRAGIFVMILRLWIKGKYRSWSHKGVMQLEEKTFYLPQNSTVWHWSLTLTIQPCSQIGACAGWTWASLYSVCWMLWNVERGDQTGQRPSTGRAKL